MKSLALIVNRKNILLSKYAKDALDIAWKHFSTSDTFSKKSTANPVPAPRVIIPGNCRTSKPPISTPQCEVAVIIGGSNNGYGYFAAEQLLRHGAKRVVLADGVDESVGESACERLCKAYGKDRAKFYHCDARNSCQIEGTYTRLFTLGKETRYIRQSTDLKRTRTLLKGIFTSSYCRDEKIGILFNDLDAVQSLPEHSRLNYCKDSIKISNTQRLTRLGVKLMQQQRRRGIIVNCASILGFMGWPLADDAVPVYCAGEPVLETTLRMARSFPVEETSVRLVCLCPANRALDSIGLPDLPTENESCEGRISCAPD
ncbi:hypothetical protein TSAR_015318, partial [Trichomalopsis sarcophagae]